MPRFLSDAGGARATLLIPSNLIWLCPQIQFLGSEVTQFIAQLTIIVVPLRTDFCLQGLVGPLALYWALEARVSLLLLFSHKAITVKWKSKDAATLIF